MSQRQVKQAAGVLLERRLQRKHLSLFSKKVFETVSPGDVYLHNWHIDMICEHLEAVYQRQILRLQINIPPRYLKSITASVAFPAWVLGKDPTHRIMCVSYSHFLAYKHSADCKLVIESDWYKTLFPDTQLKYGETNKRELTTIFRGQRLATSMGGTVLGEGAHTIVIDDPLDPEQAYSKADRIKSNRQYDQTISTRLNDKKTGAIVIIMQRLNIDDVCGHAQKQEDWTVLKIPGQMRKKSFFHYKAVDKYGTVKKRKKTLQKDALLHPKYEGPAEMEKMKIKLGSYGFSSQYQQDPTPEGGGIIKLSWFNKYKYPPRPEEIVYISQFWDTAQKADEVLHAPWVCGTFYSTYTAHYLVHVFRDWMNYPKGKAQVKNLNDKFKPNVIVIEAKSTGQSLIQELNGLPVIGFEPEKDKITRLSTESPLVEAGAIWLPEQASWLFDFEEEIQHFPNSVYKDQADMFSMALKHFRVKGSVDAISIGTTASQVA